MTVTLYQFPISHYCEKVRWALEYKGVPYKIKNLLPGQHIKFAKTVAASTCVPIVSYRDKKGETQYLQESAAIIDWLDATYPDKPLTPASPKEQAAAIAWEKFADEDIGPHVRRWAYFTLLENPKVVLPALTSGAPLLAKPLFRMFFPKVREIMKKRMNIYPAESQDSAARLDAAFANIDAGISGKDFLVGDHFSRADLAVAALLAPLFTPKQYGVKWPKKMPEPLQSWTAARLDKLAWAENIYQNYR
ncbi:MAG: glutathione S-transferase family protein [Alcanivoracaceae bacterium]|nr:glutathione S-transferase family protein [Alcanivoracaceae bacterium]